MSIEMYLKAILEQNQIIIRQNMELLKEKRYDVPSESYDKLMSDSQSVYDYVKGYVLRQDDDYLDKSGIAHK